MLRFLRKYSSSIGVKILYGLLAALFILWMGGGIGGERRQDVAVVYAQVISHQALEQLIEQALLRHEAARLGIAVTNAEIDETVQRMPDLQQNGRFDRSLLEAYLRGERVPGAFE